MMSATGKIAVLLVVTIWVTGGIAATAVSMKQRSEMLQCAQIDGNSPGQKVESTAEFKVVLDRGWASAECITKQ